MGKHPKRTRRPLSISEKFQRTAAFKKFKETFSGTDTFRILKEQCLEDLRAKKAEVEAKIIEANSEGFRETTESKGAVFERFKGKDFLKKYQKYHFKKLKNEESEIETDIAEVDTNLLVREFEKTPEGREVWRRITGYYQQIWMFFCWEIILRSNTFRKWCNSKGIAPWPVFNLYYCPSRVRISPATQTFNEFLSTIPGRRATKRLQIFKYLWPDLYGKGKKRGFGVKDLLPQENHEKTDSDDYEGAEYPSLSELNPLQKALAAYDMSKKCGLILIGSSPQGALVTGGTSKERNLMEITRRLFPQTEGKHPSHDEEANRCLQQVKRWIAKVEKLIHLVDM